MTADYRSGTDEYYASGDFHEILDTIVEAHLPGSDVTGHVQIEGYIPPSDVPEHLELLCSLISAAGAYEVRTMAGSLMVGVQGPDGRRFERVAESDLPLIREATGIAPG